MRTAIPKTSGYVQTPMTGTFGPGQGRAGEHPVRQPRGPPSLDELLAKPTSKHDGSKNFATRQRRRAVHSLVRAGMERRGARGPPSSGSLTPVSENDPSFSSDNDSDSIGSGNLSGKPSIGSLRAAANGAIGSERAKERKSQSLERNSNGTRFSTASLSSEEGIAVGGKIVEIKKENSDVVIAGGLKTPMLVLSSAEKRSSSVF